MLSFISNFNFIILILFTAFYSYQVFYVFVALFKKSDRLVCSKDHTYAVLIAARNESAVIKQLIESIKMQKYPSSLIKIFVVADNCTDDTARIARESGAVVFERFNRQQVGKGYALDFALKEIYSMGEKFDGYFVFDADNLLDENYIREMNNVFGNGYRVVTSYRNSKNYDTNWISAGYSLWFLREAKFLNNSRMMLKTGCAISGTGFLVHSDIFEKNNGWKHHLMTEDIEFSIDSAISGEIIGYCDKAVIYDEQPYSLEQSWNQRLRWAKGFYQVFAKYGLDLVKSMIKRKSFVCYDMLMTVSPAMLLSILGILINSIFLIIGLLNADVYPSIIRETTKSIFMSFLNSYFIFFALGVVTTITEWKKINTTKINKIKYMFTFPLFIFTYMPISLVALFKKIEWKPITHNISKSIEEVTIEN